MDGSHSHDMTQDENGQNELEGDGCEGHEKARFLVYPSCKKDGKSRKR
jgi:hypothetical protein